MACRIGKEFPPARPDPQIRVELSDAGGLRFRGVESGGDGGLVCVPRFDQEGHQLPSIADFNFNGTPTYMVKIYASEGTYVDRGTSVLAWEQTSCCGLRTSFSERWQSSLTQTLPARHVSRDATADRVIANARFGSPAQPDPRPRAQLSDWREPDWQRPHP